MFPGPEARQAHRQDAMADWRRPEGASGVERGGLKVSGFRALGV